MSQSGPLRRAFTTYARPYTRHLVVSVVFGLLALAAGVTAPQVTRTIVDRVDILSRGGAHSVAGGPGAGIFGLAVLLFVLGALQAGFNFLRRFVAARISLFMETDLRNDFYAHLQRLPIAVHDSWQSGQLLTRAMGDISAIRRFVGFGLPFLVVSVATFFGVLVMLLRLDLTLGLVTAAVLLPTGFIVNRFEGRYRTVARSIQDQQGDLGTTIEESAAGIRVIKSFGQAGLVKRRFGVGAEQLHVSSMEGVRLRAFFWTVLDTLPNLTMVALLLVGGIAVIQHRLSLGTLVAFFSYLAMLVFPLMVLGWITAMGEEAITAAQRVYEVLDVPVAIADRPGARELATCRGHVRFRDVTFGYGADRPVLRGFDLEIAPGETMALVGRTGCGKSTVAALLARLYDVSAGAIELDGASISELTLRSLRGHLGVAFEEPILFSASVRENLTLGYPEAREQEVLEALRVSQAEFALDLPYGLDTRVGEQGHTLSGGQRQRLALARAVVGHPRVMVLDDPLSAVDVHTEALIESSLANVLAGVTALLVVHRPSTLALADRVALMDEGRVVAVGTHRELMRTQRLYRDILSQHSDAEEVAV
ncbi:MAG: ABC transporter ATP-binding protein [Candidatus Dormibacteria bacterium]